MLRSQNHPLGRLLRKIENKRIAATIRDGRVPKGITFERICEALNATKPRGPMECYGLVSAKQFRAGKLFKDHGIVGARSVTAEFAKLLADAMGGYAASTISTFNAHEMGDGSTAESSADSELVSAQDGRAVGSQTHGASSNIYASTATITAGGAYTVIEHGIFDTTGASERLLDRTVIDSFTVAADDTVEWTYSLTIVTAG